MPRKRSAVPWPEQHDNGIWYAHWYDADAKRTRRESLGTSSDAEATEAFARWLTQGPRGARSVGASSVTVHYALDSYFTEHVEKNVVDIERQRDAIAHLKTFFPPARLLASVDIAASRAYAEARRKGAVGGGQRRRDPVGSDSTIRRELNVLAAAGRHALRWKRITPADLPSIELPAENRNTQVKWLTKEQVNLALAISYGRLHDFIELAYYFAARRRSVEQLLKSQVSLQHGVVDLHPPGARVTKKRKPKVPIYKAVRPTVERLMQGDSIYLLGNSGSVYRDFVSLMAALGIEAHPHMLRHSRATHLLMDGESIYKVAKLLGDTVQTVERVYGHFDTEFLQTESGLVA